MKIAIIFGTRPEAIKVASTYHELKMKKIEVLSILTGQHQEMLYPVLDIFNIVPSYDLKLMKANQSLSELTGRMILELQKIVEKEKIDYILVQGDTTSACIGALVGFYNRIPVGHIEAGLRTGNIYSPFPEEMNRKLISLLASVHFAPTIENVNNLLREGYEKSKIKITGNSVIDALQWIKSNKNNKLNEIREKLGLKEKKYILLTMHRRENWGKPMEECLTAIRDYMLNKTDIYLVFPLHLNPKIREIAYQVFNNFERVIFLEPLEYLHFISVLEGALYVMTDSGGIQEEAPSLGKPVLVLRDSTERPEAIKAGTAILVGTNYLEVQKYMKLMETELFDQMSCKVNPYGDGTTSKKIVEYLMEWNDQRNE
ncbi:non-hydrolyzing UDP-N-acetylglucosamine 2-epimerase [Fusobacterium necrophorum]|uniref:UDP-N-acetylglucosamine 2-epimerase (non-hydrolyzing) n=1 Tax=Fusobacterium necrophorum DJ-2 TaxID=1441737 RepID=A0AB73C023_9FUSO|nr:UDP-N-acetylglucosamine 2-epimerase (non-hydrolyzing) [Fusobacterium necrophorum]KDE63562.1 UDP-N-acetylglucosamine 2-epimerase [Fusobacterium necrophorum DJ-1]KDE67191.1 UDP-N-acetylglucosamine 2-epimerase [Fusobacterium necrophorum BFTR-1]KDE67586.1 UDP-N-acetylglucosamine 2-epimerase [Fusobacterium necrophorum DAB]KDE69329.1 UDP-N-acetylglucosamine 2-epimerase [Fusobacterium necrophorum DJ-2]MCF0163581.1 UDP-N-acetylglucosamine 2-epimerase (non-hydrolyzing) [Fusobacterium necrophorum]